MQNEMIKTGIKKYPAMISNGAHSAIVGKISGINKKNLMIPLIEIFIFIVPPGLSSYLSFSSKYFAMIRSNNLLIVMFLKAACALSRVCNAFDV